MTVHHTEVRRASDRLGGPSIAGLLSLLLALATTACDDEAPRPDAGDPCGGRCLTEIGEVCDEETGTCYIPQPDAADADVGPDVPVDAEDDAPEVFICQTDDQCGANQYCGPDGDCLYGCRTDPDNCDDCDVYPLTCEDDLSCHPVDHECAAGCFVDEDCPATRFCQAETGLCQRGCRLDPDNCLEITQDASFACSPTTRTCIDGTCTGPDQCPAGSVCDGGRCVWGCETTPDSCGAGQFCQASSRTCLPLPCECDPEDSNETCDAVCNDGSTISAFYCERTTQLCTQGCRIFDDGTDNCGVGTICDEVAHRCVPGCRSDETCPFGTYCGDDDACVAGCKPGECPSPLICNLDTRACVAVACSVDGDCPANAYCSSGGNCLEGCRLDDPGTPAVDEENCPEGLVCSPSARECQVASCTDNDDCPLGTYCDVSNRCRTGCAGLDERCPEGQPCSPLTLVCGCIGDSDCPDDTHCSAPVCEVDCTPDNPFTPESEDSCTAPLVCDPGSGRCVGNCIDTETGSRNDTPETATCVLFDEADLSDPTQLNLCRSGATFLPPDSYCDSTPATYCFEGVACTGGDFDWYTMILRAGDRISFFADYAQPASTIFVLELTSADNPSKRIRGAGATATGVGAEDFSIDETNQYFLRAFTTEDRAVTYDLRVEVDRVFVCLDDAYETMGNNEDNDSPLRAPELQNSETEAMISSLSICAADRDFFAIDLFAGNDFLAIVDPTTDDDALQLHLGTSAGSDLHTTTNLDNRTLNLAAGDWDDGDPTNTNDVAIDDAIGVDGALIPFSDRMYLRIKSPDPSVEVPYTLTYRTARGSAVCEDDAYEPNDVPENVLSRATFEIDSTFDVPSQVTFEGARLCPGDGGTGSEVDLYKVVIWPGSGIEDGYLTATITQPSTRAVVSILDSSLTTLAGPATAQVTTGGTLSAGTYYVRVVHNGAGGEELPWQGDTYHLTLRYELTVCSDDAREPNGTPGTASELHTTTLIAQSQECGGLAFTDLCVPDTIGAGNLCLCQSTASLVACPGDEDWYAFQALVGDRFSIKVTPTSGSSEDLDVILYPPTCETPEVPGSCSDLAIFFPDTGTARTKTDVTVQPAISGEIVLDYYLQIRNFSSEPMGYQILVEVFGTGSRDCPADPWDSTYAAYPGVNEASCEVSGCTLSLQGDNDQREGNICYWDQQDWFRFDVAADQAQHVVVAFNSAEGRMEGTLYDSEGDFVVDLEDMRDTDIDGVEMLLDGLAAGTYELEVYMVGRGGAVFGSRPNDYTVFISDIICQDGIWSVGDDIWSWTDGEECDPTSGASNLTMCGSNSACTLDCTCSP